MKLSAVGTRCIRTPRGNRIDKKFIYRILSNRAYLGEAVHKGDSYPGEHDGIIDRETWDRVHVILQDSPRKRAARIGRIARLIGDGKAQEARAAIKTLSAEIGDDDPEITRARTLLDFMEGDA